MNVLKSYPPKIKKLAILITVPIALIALLTFIQPTRGFSVNSSFVSDTVDSYTQSSPAIKPVEVNTQIQDVEITDFSLFIPAINLSHKIKYNVDPRHKEDYLPILEDYIAHGKFTRLPSTGKGRVYLFAHSKKAPIGVTPYAGYFSHIHELGKNDKVYVTLNDATYIYSVRESKIVEPTEISIYTGESDKVEIAMQACYPPGTTEKRIIVFADLVAVK